MSGFFVPLALTLLAAELYNILAFHLTFAPATIAPALVASVLIAVARKLAVLLHHLWISCEEYEPLHNMRKRRPEAA